MSAITSVLDAPAATALAWTLLHFVWQGAVLATGFLLASRHSRSGASARYAAGVATLAAMLVTPVATYFVVNSRATPGGVQATAPAIPAATTTGAAQPEAAFPGVDTSARAWPASMTATVVGLWMLGVCVFAMRLAGGWVLARRLVVFTRQPVGMEVERLAVGLSRQLGIDRVVRVAQSSGLTVPVMVGWLKPVVLLPAAVLAALTPAQIEALLAHELAHVRRHDYLINVLQSVVETLLFYHPAVWWVSHRVRVEREHCCDDLTVGVCDRLAYATALSDLAALSAPASPALAATGGSLLDRIRRIVEPSEHADDASAGWLPVLAFVFLASAVVPIAVASGRPAETGAQSGAAAAPAVSGSGNAGRPDVPQGVASGVTGGVPGGMGGGVTGGVRGGVAGGVTGGVASGVEGQLPSAEEDVQSTDTRERQLRELAAKMEAVQRESHQRLIEIQKKMQALALERLDSHLNLQLGQLKAELEALKTQQAQLKVHSELGLADPGALASIEGRMAVLQQQIAGATRERALEATEIELHAARARQQAQLARAIDEYTSAERRVALEAQAAAASGRLSAAAALVAGTVDMPADERVRAGDVLVIEIHGEPDVPRAYAVQQERSGCRSVPRCACRG